MISVGVVIVEGVGAVWVGVIGANGVVGIGVGCARIVFQRLA